MATNFFLFQSLCDQVCRNVGSQDNLTELRAQDWVNRAIIRFTEMGEWSWQRGYQLPFPNTVNNVTSANQEIYSVPNCIRIESLFMKSPIQRRLTLLDDRKFRRMYPNNIATGTPYYYRHVGRVNTGGAVDTLQIGLYPIPDSAYTLQWDGVQAMPTLVNATDDIRALTGMPQFMVDILIEMATAIAWKEIDDADNGSQLKEAVARLKSAYGKDQHDIDDRLIMAPFESEDIDRYFDPQLDPRFNE